MALRPPARRKRSVRGSPLANSAWTGKLELEVRRHLSGESSGHDPSHAFRVRNLAVRIAVVTGADAEVVEAAALLHDIGHGTGRAGHAKRGAELAKETLSKCGFPETKISAVVACIGHHHWKPGRADDPKKPTAEYQAFADADRLDALGAIVSLAPSLLAALTGGRSGIQSQRPRPKPRMEFRRSTIFTISCCSCRMTCTPNRVGVWRCAE